ncbi:MAG: glycosyltransferase [Rickettsiales bacterium]|jgi:glycosyltransferase involved in cell wall biosynthesis|nr:glycosyltransferase [Rickettsiales bacterium]
MVKMMPKISVIIPVFNAQEHLKECLESVKKQTMEDIEIICIDDVSIDNSFDILSQYSNSDDRFIIKRCKQLSGAAFARNIGLQTAKGEYIGFVDADDYIDPNFYDVLYKRAKENNADLVRTTYKHIDAPKTWDDNFNQVIETKFANNVCLNVNDHSVAIWNAIYKTSYIANNNIDFDVSIKKLHDVLFTAKATFYSSKSIPAIGTYYYHRENIKGQLSSFSIDRADFTRMSNRATLTFINSADYKNIDDYLTAFKRCVWRYNMTFEKILSEKTGIDGEYLRQYFAEFVEEFNKCKKIDDLILRYGENYFKHLISSNFKSYLESRKKKLCGAKRKTSFLKKIFSVKKENNHKVICIFGLKIKF